MSGAGLGDEVIVAPGDYPLSATLGDPTQITIRGVPGKPRPIVNGGANQSLAPALVNAAAGDYRQATGSPTINAGVNAAANGTLDFEGGARVIGTTDIGADEYQPVPASAPAPASPTPTPTPPASAEPPPAFAGVTLASTRLTMARGIVTLKLSCPAGTTGRCSGRTRLTAQPRRASSRAASRVVVGRTSFSISPGTRKRVKVRVSRAGRRLLNRLPRVRGRAATVASSGAGAAKTTVAAVTIRRRHR